MQPIPLRYLTDAGKGPRFTEMNQNRARGAAEISKILQAESLLLFELQSRITEEGIDNLPCNEEHFNDHLSDYHHRSIIEEQYSIICEVYLLTYQVYKIMGVSLLENQVRESLQELEYLWHKFITLEPP